MELSRWVLLLQGRNRTKIVICKLFTILQYPTGTYHDNAASLCGNYGGFIASAESMEKQAEKNCIHCLSTQNFINYRNTLFPCQAMLILCWEVTTKQELFSGIMELLCLGVTGIVVNQMENPSK